MSGSLEDIARAVRAGDWVQVADRVRATADDGVASAEILTNGLVPGLQAVGELFKEGQAFLPEIFISVRAMQAGLDLIRPSLATGDAPVKGTVVLGTVEGDLHDIGKNLVGMLLEGNGYKVIDLGVDVSADSFVDSAEEHGADLVAMSALLTTTTPQFRTVIERLGSKGMRGRVKVLIGGASASSALAHEVGADGFADDCFGAVDQAEALIDRKGALR